MSGLLSLLIFAGLFYLMMRFGCGAHMVHGHGHDKAQGGSKDPVCGMSVPADRGYSKVHDGTTYRFCSRQCLDEFDQHPTRYLEATAGRG